MVRLAALALAALVVAPGASAEIVARGVRDGMMSLAATGQPVVAYVHGSSFIVTTRVGTHRWRTERVATVQPGSEVVALSVAATGPVALVERGDLRKLTLYRRLGFGWQTVKLGGVLTANVRLGLPGLVLDGQGNAVVAYTRWNGATLDSKLMLARIDLRRKVRLTQITREGFPQSDVPPPAAPVIVGGRVHVVERYGYRTVLATIEWYPDKRTWTGLGLDAGLGDFPVGPLYAGLSPAGTLFAAWTDSISLYGEAPVTLARRTHNASSRIVLDRALTTGLALPATGAEVAANEWVGGDPDLGGNVDWAATIVRKSQLTELDGWIAAYGIAPRGGRDLLLARPSGLSWFRAPSRPAMHMTIKATVEANGRVHVSGRVPGIASGRVAIYRERPGFPRQLAGHATIAGTAFAFSDKASGRPILYRAVYTEPVTGIPFAALLREPVSAR